MTDREQRGLVIAATKKIQRKGAAFVVPSQNAHGKYTVVGRQCTCPDFEERQQPCKHIFAVEFFVSRETVTNPDGCTVVTETAAARVTYGQNWPAYNAAQTTEKDHFCRLLRDLCAGIEEPAQKRGRPRLPLADMLFSTAYKTYSTVSARRFMTDLRSACTAGYVSQTPHYNSLFNYFENEELTPLIQELIVASSLPLRAIETDFAVDSTGFGTSGFFRYYSMKYGREQQVRDWLKVHVAVGVKTNVVTSVEVSDRTSPDDLHFPTLVEETAENFTIREVSADKAYSSNRSLGLVDRLGGTPFIPFKNHSRGDGKNPLWNKLFHFFSLNREEFEAHYHKRSNVEATFSAIKRVFGGHMRSRTLVAQTNEVLLKVLCHNIRCLIHAIHELGLNPVFERIACPGKPVAAQELNGI